MAAILERCREPDELPSIGDMAEVLDPKRAALRDAAAAAVCASLGPPHGDASAAAELWREILAGRWTLVDHFERDGRQFFIARRNDPAARAPGQPTPLTPRQRHVATHAALGHSNKQIAYDLGLSVGTVATHLAAAVRKLRVGSRAALIRTMAAVMGTPDTDRRGMELPGLAHRRNDHGAPAERLSTIA